MGHDDDPRGWHFWRRSFWTRPALLVVVALAVAPASAVLGAHAVGSVASGVAVQRDSLQEVPGRARGPHHQRRTPDTWELVVGAGEVRDEFTMSWSASRALEAEASYDVTGLVHDGDVVAVRLRSGRVLTTWATGGRGGLFFLGCAVMALGISVGGLGYARRKAHAAGGWWSVTGGRVDMRTHDGASAFATFAIVGGGLPAIALMAGVPWWLLVAPALPLVLVLALRGRRSGAGRHARA